MPAGPERCGGSQNQSKRLQRTDRGSLFTQLRSEPMRVKNAARTHAIDATDNIDHLTRRALVRI